MGLRAGASIGCAPGHAAKEDYHYARHGMHALFLFFDPLRGWPPWRQRTHRHNVSSQVSGSAAHVPIS